VGSRIKSHVILGVTEFFLSQICAASEKKSLAGLDNVTSKGASAFDTLEKVVETMTSLDTLNLQPLCY